MGELKPCPFCGGEAEHDRLTISNLCCIVCSDNDCGAMMVYCEGDEAEAIEAWNTRHERTCRIEVHGLERDRQVSTVSYTCSECRKHIYRDDAYCKHCGARVVG